MAVPGVLAKSVILDILILLAEGLTVLLVPLFGEPFRRGFSCSDASLRLPHRMDTISTLVLGLAFVIGGMLLMAFVELLLSPKAFNPSCVRFRQRALPVWMVQLYRSVVTFLCGAGLTQIVTDIAKYHVGALRPHFLAVCDPDIDCSFRLNYDPFNYNEAFTCRGSNTSLIKEARLSFPSGHASMSFFCAAYIVAHLQKRLSRPEERRNAPPSKHLTCFLVRPLLQGMLLLAAWYTTVSRVMDHMHHPRDVAAGTLIGVVAAVLTVRGIRPFIPAVMLEPNEGSSLSDLRQLQPPGGGRLNHDGAHTVIIHNNSPIVPA